MITIVVNLLILIVVVYIAYLGIEMLRGIPAQGKQILYLIVALFAVVYFLNIVGVVGAGLPVYRID